MKDEDEILADIRETRAGTQELHAECLADGNLEVAARCAVLLAELEGLTRFVTSDKGTN